MKVSILKRLVREEIKIFMDKGNLSEEFSEQEYKELRDFIRNELASIFFDLFRKRNVWVK